MPPKAEKNTEKPVEKADKAEKAVAVIDPKVAAARERDLEAAISSITKAYGDGAIMRLGDARRCARLKSSLRAVWQLTSPWAWAVCPAVAWWKSLGRNLPVKRRSCCT